MVSSHGLGVSLVRRTKRAHLRAPKDFVCGYDTSPNVVADTATCQARVEQSQLFKDPIVELMEDKANLGSAFTGNTDFSAAGLANYDDYSKKMSNDLTIMLRGGSPVVFRRPPWNRGQSADEIMKAEVEAFTRFKRILYSIQETNGMVVSPFEKNVEIWRQLWRVVETCQVVLQIVDARNPLFFHSQNLISYVRDTDESKICILLINKADLLDERQLREWHSYFKENGVSAVFYSAASSDLEGDDRRKRSHTNSNESGVEETTADTTQQFASNIHERAMIHQPEADSKDGAGGGLNRPRDNDVVAMLTARPRVMTREELIDLMHSIKMTNFPGLQRICVGFVGFPNAGKSSTINSLMGKRKTAVSFTPGKTKHLQTLHFDEFLVLCDCPGLVLPKLIDNPSLMTINGMVNVDQVSDVLPAIKQIASLVPQFVFEEHYSISIPISKKRETGRQDFCSHEELLVAYCAHRGLFTRNQAPDFSKSSRIIIKDVISGRLRCCFPPPEHDFWRFNGFDFHRPAPGHVPASQQLKKKAASVFLVRTEEEMVRHIDEGFFSQTNSSQLHLRGQSVCAGADEQMTIPLHKLRKGPKKTKERETQEKVLP